MHIDIGQTVQIITIISFLAGTVNYLIVGPIQGALQTLEKAIGELKLMLTTLEKEQKLILERLIITEQSAKSAHKRLDIIDSINDHG